jgi:hypothetical protein
VGGGAARRGRADRPRRRTAVGSFDLAVEPGIVAAVVVAAVVIWAWPRLADRLRWRGLVAVGALAALAWSITLALGHGIAGINEPLEGPSDYLVSVPLIHSPGDFLATFTERIDAYSTHVRSHPPGMALLLYGLDRAGLGGSWPASALILLAAASTVPAVLIAARAVAGEELARRAAPFLALAPAAVWIATTADALFMAVGAWAVVLLVLAVGRRGAHADALALAGGVVFGIACFLSFGLVLLALIPAAVAIAAKRPRPLVIGAAGATLVGACFLAAGYWWLDGWTAAREQYLGSIARSRPYDFFLVSNLAAFALASGPALALALGRLRDHRLWLLAGAGLAAVAVADLSGMSKGEVERIWLPFLPWAMVATAALPTRPGILRATLAAQAACGIAIEVGVATIW